MYEIIIETYPELTDIDFLIGGCITLRDDGDGVVYLAAWDFSKPIPKGLKLGK